MNEEECSGDGDGDFIEPHNTISDTMPDERVKDHVVYHSQTGAVRWRIYTTNNVFQWLNLPFFFENAPENVKHDMIEWCRACAIANRSRLRHPPLPDSVIEFKNRPDIRLLRSAKPNKGQAKLEV